jgi:tight adherence protein B
MTLALVTFAICLAVMLGLYWAFIVRPEDARSRELARRVQRIDTVKDAVTSVTTPVSTASVVDALLSSNVRVAAGLQAFVAEAGLTWTSAGLLARCGFTAAVGAVAGVVMTGHGLGALLGLVTSAVPYVYVRRTRTQRLRTFEEQFPEAIDLIARSLRAGHTFTTGLGIAAEEIPAPVGLEFRRVYDEQNFGMAMPDALKAMARRVPVLDNLSAVMRDRFKVKRQIRVVSAHGRITAWVLSLLPPALAAVLYAVSPQFMRVLVDDPLGVRLIAFAVVMQVIGTLVISRLVQVEY